MKLLFTSLLLAVAAFAQDEPTHTVPWGASDKDGLSVLLLPQFGPPQAVAPRDEEPAKSQGVMLTISSARVAADVQNGARVKFKIYLTAVLRSGVYAFEYAEVDYNKERATTVFVPCGLTAKVAALRIVEEQTRSVDVGR